MECTSLINTRISEAFAPLFLDVINESYLHHVPKNSETHFKLIIVSNHFVDKPLIERHRMVKTCLKDLFNQGLHALTLHLFTPTEWQSKQGNVSQSPHCKDGFNH